MIGRTLSHYSIELHLGRGGMGDVYAARDTRLGRTVALKILPLGVEDEGIRRFVTEAKAASALNHPNIVTIHDIGRDGNVNFIVMERIEGTPLSAAEMPMPLERFLDLAIQITGAISTAHAAGIIHRDIKPANVMVTQSGAAKVVDFGLARLGIIDKPMSPDEATQQFSGPLTGEGKIVGTPGYISPEQLQGARAGDRSDVFSLGVMFYELLSGKSPFRGATPISTIAAILRDEPPPLSGVRRGVPAELASLVRKCLSKDPAARPSAREVHETLVRLRSAATRPRARWVTAAAFAVVLIAVAAAALWWRRESRLRWARSANQEVERLLEKEDAAAAYVVAKRAQEIAPNDSQVRHMVANLTFPVAIDSVPQGAEVAIRSYKVPGEWIPLGRTPINDVRLPYPLLRFRVTKEGHVAGELAAEPEDKLVFRLFPPNQTPEGMVMVTGGDAVFIDRRMTVPDFWIDKYEVTNAEYKRFVDAGGYRRRELWKHPFARDGQTLTWDAAMALLVDKTGRPGPAGWELGAFPDGAGRHPVEGISWYEAAAFAEFMGKSLPTVFHWERAAQNDGISSDILDLSNFGGKGSAVVGSLDGVGWFGTYDMAGNVKEWCINGNGAERYTMGGGWQDARWQYKEPDAAPPFERREGFGVRLIRQPAPLSPELLADARPRPATPAKPVDDATFAVYARLYEYDPAPLDARVEEADDSHDAWRKERVSYTAAYGNERVPAVLFLPKNAKPPYQAIVFFPGSDAVYMKNSRQLWMRMVDFYIRSGRAVIYPILQGTYERNTPGLRSGPNALRDLRIHRAKDIRRTVDYLASRKDIDAQRIGYYGVSLGANNAAMPLATDGRFRVAVLFGGGLNNAPHLPEVKQDTFLPRVKTPALLIGGRDDFQFPLESSQKPFFALLGTPPDQKKHVVFEGGHVPTRFNDAVREILAWTDRWMGPVER